MKGISNYILITGLFLAILSACDSINVEPEKERIFVKMYGGEQKEEGIDVKQLSDGGYIVLGNSYSNFGGQFGGQDIIVIRTDSEGNELWRKRIGTPGFDEGKELKLDDSENIYVVGSFGMNNGSKLGQITKLSIAGDIINQTTFGDSTHVYRFNSTEIFGDFLFVTGESSNVFPKSSQTAADSLDFILLAYNRNDLSFYDIKYEGFSGIDQAVSILRTGIEKDVNEDFEKIRIEVLANVSRTTADGLNAATGDFFFTLDDFTIQTGGTAGFVPVKGNVSGYFMAKKALRKSPNGDEYFFIANYLTSLSDVTSEQSIVLFSKGKGTDPVFLDDLPFSGGGISSGEGITYFPSISTSNKVVVATTTNAYSDAQSNTDILINSYEAGAVLSENTDWNSTPRLHGFNSNDRAGNIIQSSDGGLVLVGTIGFDDQIESSNTMICLIKTNPNGFVE
ncbi:hypothetical protein [Marinigracilibium pacificum]|uniref:Uncharacterized protein n=1 Tax=Marinigracilibium pacificum TaxID=2729599 RepID=A0A848J4P9_9BACT|nr:hypothetical protein [Marinigracilibium pacificum]NMM49329.1 hypothetical protein [Marinigracilibium pacificum]